MRYRTVLMTGFKAGESSEGVGEPGRANTPADGARTWHVPSCKHAKPRGMPELRHVSNPISLMARWRLDLIRCMVSALPHLVSRRSTCRPVPPEGIGRCKLLTLSRCNNATPDHVVSSCSSSFWDVAHLGVDPGAERCGAMKPCFYLKSVQHNAVRLSNFALALNVTAASSELECDCSTHVLSFVTEDVDVEGAKRAFMLSSHDPRLRRCAIFLSSWLRQNNGACEADDAIFLCVSPSASFTFKPKVELWSLHGRRQTTMHIVEFPLPDQCTALLRLALLTNIVGHPSLTGAHVVDVLVDSGDDELLHARIVTSRIKAGAKIIYAQPLGLKLDQSAHCATCFGIIYYALAPPALSFVKYLLEQNVARPNSTTSRARVICQGIRRDTQCICALGQRRSWRLTVGSVGEQGQGPGAAAAAGGEKAEKEAAGASVDQVATTYERRAATVEVGNPAEMRLSHAYAHTHAQAAARRARVLQLRKCFASPRLAIGHPTTSTFKSTIINGLALTMRLECESFVVGSVGWSPSGPSACESVDDAANVSETQRMLTAEFEHSQRGLHTSSIACEWAGWLPRQTQRSGGPSMGHDPACHAWSGCTSYCTCWPAIIPTSHTGSSWKARYDGDGEDVSASVMLDAAYRTDSHDMIYCWWSLVNDDADSDDDDDDYLVLDEEAVHVWVVIMTARQIQA
ncbi:uncharacterized protein MYCFIDRAFT_173805 [Pseudocercospora fijiensis CIRAD86]|uniref:Uncharacterized protein n=1 Tax=Pseudocercospora fijiensis (strain CIRAD86) TaxID=383855 RepID=M2Z523_PSEFD|nr:uncharacterized protein MYCFIDRAFT_173805 [Pseudocercospora fijiensis CIRAD86]EME84910.1 hypothetical protein MYCFIDRAFT_173805 [Pseudocercospora fijiensis CIRAD86]